MNYFAFFLLFAARLTGSVLDETSFFWWKILPSKDYNRDLKTLKTILLKLAYFFLIPLIPKSLRTADYHIKGSFYWVRLKSSQIRTRDDWVQSASATTMLFPFLGSRHRLLKGLKKMETAEQQINFFREDGFKFEANKCSLTCTHTHAHTHMHTLSHTHSHTHTPLHKKMSVSKLDLTILCQKPVKMSRTFQTSWKAASCC